MKDKLSEVRLQKLHPDVRDSFRAFIEECENSLDIILRITQGLRTTDEQDKLYAIGRTEPGKIVTNAKGGTSFHNYGLAVDLAVVVSRKGAKDIKEIAEIDWEFDMSRLKPVALKYGIEWGGDWVSLKDYPHWQITFGHTVRQLLAIAEQKKVDGNGYVTIV
jgi:hypothetical protein